MLPFLGLMITFLGIQVAPPPPGPAPWEEAGRVRHARLVGGSISVDDYPASAIRAGAEGTVLTRFVVSRSGRPTNCMVAQSSGNAALDEVSCRIVTERFRFEPARDPAGKRIEETHEQRFIWRLPDSIPPPESAPQD